MKPDTPFAGLLGTGGAGIYKTTDGGETWTPVTIPQLAKAHLGRIGVVVAPGGQRVYAIVSERKEGGLYRSDDGGATWKRITEDARIQGNGYFSRVFLDPHNPDIVFVAQTSLYRSTDGGVTFESYKGAPGGDDNHALWIDPTNSDYMIMGSDQGATISMDGGKTWSSWYNQPTGQIYHVSTDNRFPYWVYGTQQDSGSVATLSRGDYGAITFLDWDPIGGLRVRLHRSRSDRSQHCLRGRRGSRTVAHRSHQPAGEGGLAQRQPRWRLPHRDQSSAGVLAAGPARSLRRNAVPAADQR